MALKTIIALGYFSILVSFMPVMAAEAYKTSVVLERSPTIKACLINEKNQQSCVNADLPSSAGFVSKLIQVDFVHTDGAAWIALTNRKASLCGFSVRSQGIICTHFAEQDFDKVDVNFQSGVFSFTPARPTAIIDDANLQAFGIVFTKGLDRVSAVLQSRLSETTQVGAIDAGSGFRATFDEVDDDDGCGGDSPQINDCSGGPGREGGGGAGGGGGGQIVIIPGPRLPPPPPVVIDGVVLPPPVVNICGLLPICTTQNPPVENPDLLEERIRQCEVNYDADMDECQAYSRAMDIRTLRACRARAADRLALCLQRAKTSK